MKNRNFIFLRMILTCTIAFLLFSGCKKNKEDEDLEIKSKIDGLSFKLPMFALKGENIEVQAIGPIVPSSGVTYKWYGSNIIRDTVNSDKVKIIVPDSLGTYNVSLKVSAKGYYDRIITKSITSINPRRNESLKGIKVPKDSILDKRDDRWYYTVKIGDLEWFAENLKWKGAGNGYDNTNIAGDVLGRLYTWNDATNGVSSKGLGEGVQGVCPEGWSIPTNEDWVNLANAIGGKSYNFIDDWNGLGAKLMASATLNGTNLWNYTANFTSSNDYGWNAIPSGTCSTGYTEYKGLYSYGFWWSATEKDGENANYRYIFYDFGDFPVNYVEKDGFGAAVRCVRKINQ